MTYMAFNALHALIFCIDSADIVSTFQMIHNCLNIQQIFNQKKVLESSESTVLTLQVHFGSYLPQYSTDF